MAKNLDNIFWGGDADSAVHLGDPGTTAPTGLGAPGAGWEELGWLHEDGIEQERATSDNSVKAHQGGKEVRKRVTIDSETFAVAALESNAVSLGLVYPAATVTTESGVTKIVPSGKADIDKAIIIDDFDGDKHYRYVITKASIALDDTIVLSSTDATAYKFLITALEYYILTNDPAVAV